LLQGGETWFSVVPGEGRRHPTKGQEAREWSRAKIEAEALDEAEIMGVLKDPEFIGGNADRQTKTRQAHLDGYNLCLNALAALANNDHYKEWFGTHTPQRFQEVREHFTRIKNGMESRKFTYILTGQGCKSNSHAYTHKGVTRIWMCDLFWTSPPTGANSKSGTVLHEHSHASAGTDDLIYDRDDCRQLAKDDPDRAVRNASNYEYFTE
jgi:Lysine-specific metallo-endopeptidase